MVAPIVSTSKHLSMQFFRARSWSQVPAQPFCSIFSSMAKPCMYITIDDGNDETFASIRGPAQPCAYNLSRAARPLAELSPLRAAACTWGQKRLQARSRPIANPTKVHSSQKRAHPNHVKHDQTRGRKKRSNTIKKRSNKCFFSTLAQPQLLRGRALA